MFNDKAFDGSDVISKPVLFNRAIEKANEVFQVKIDLSSLHLSVLVAIQEKRKGEEGLVEYYKDLMGIFFIENSHDDPKYKGLKVEGEVHNHPADYRLTDEAKKYLQYVLEYHPISTKDDFEGMSPIIGLLNTIKRSSGNAIGHRFAFRNVYFRREFNKETKTEVLYHRVEAAQIRTDCCLVNQYIQISDGPMSVTSCVIPCSFEQIKKHLNTPGDER